MQTDEEALPTSRDRWWTAGLIALLVLPLVVSAFYLWFSVGTAYYPNTDWAIFELRARDVLHHAVYVGPYSRFGWNHPGPLLFYVLAGPYKLLGSRSISMHITALLVNGATLVAIGWVAFRRGRLPMVIAALVPVGLLTHALGADMLRNPWNPYLPIIPLLLLFLLCWSVAVGDLWMLPIAIAVASFAIQSHVGLALESVTVLVLALVAVVVRGVRTPPEERRAWWRRVATVTGVSLGVFAVLWFPVFWGTFVRHDGNLQNLIDFFTGSHDTQGVTKGLEVLGLQWGPRPEWILGPRGLGLLGNQYVESYWWIPVGLALGVAATVVASRRRSTDTVWLAVFLAVGFVVAVIAVSNVVDILYPYLTRWTWVLGTALGILVLRGAWFAFPPDRRATVLRWSLPGAVVILAVLSAMETVDALNAGTPFAAQQGAERVITREVLAHLPEGKGPVLIDTSHGGIVAPGIALALERRGIATKMVPDQVVVYGTGRTPQGPPYRAELIPVLGDEQIRAFTPPGPRIAHYVRQQTAADRRRLKAYLKQAREIPPGPARTAFLKLLEQGVHGPAEEIAVYLANPDR
ncbi:MAG: hypothetical protein ACXWA9_13300 [Acidimicrobiia bacterium]